MLDTDNELEKCLKLLDIMSNISRLALTKGENLEEKLKYNLLQKTFSETRNKLMPLIFDYEDAKTITEKED